MACYYPMQALKLAARTKLGKSVIKFISRNMAQSIVNHPDLISGLPCGQCVGCRLERSRQWAIRMVHEAQLHESNCFITLTFDDDHLKDRDQPMSLDKRDFQLFMKRLRKVYPNVRYYMCGEYGERLKRPHYHAILFGLDFPDKELEKVKDGYRYFTSQSLSKLWPFGFHIITDVTFDTCAYVARYIMKKHLGKDAWKNYFEYFDENTGEFVGQRLPEYTTMSRRSGIGKAWFDKYLRDIYPKDKFYLRGKGYMRPPKYYDSLYELVDPDDYSRIKEARTSASKSNLADNSPERLHAKQVVKLAQINNLSRNLE